MTTGNDDGGLELLTSDYGLLLRIDNTPLVVVDGSLEGKVYLVVESHPEILDKMVLTCDHHLDPLDSYQTIEDSDETEKVLISKKNVSGYRAASMAKRLIKAAGKGKAKNALAEDELKLPAGGISEKDAVAIIFGEEFTTKSGVAYEALAAHVGKNNPAHMPELVDFRDKYHVDRTHGPGSIRHNPSRDKGAVPPRVSEALHNYSQ
ncbi:hypothetical protein JXB11_03580 [Candidatus Woesearchaeota archaeon]|nr:hypothetical protein [Candidatus Woesearchaeota archaeon]